MFTTIAVSRAFARPPIDSLSKVIEDALYDRAGVSSSTGRCQGLALDESRIPRSLDVTIQVPCDPTTDVDVPWVADMDVAGCQARASLDLPACEVREGMASLLYNVEVRV